MPERDIEKILEKMECLRSDVTNLRVDLPKIAKEHAEEAVKHKSIFTKGERWTGLGFMVTLLLVIFSAYGKFITVADTVKSLQETVKTKEVIQSSDWVRANKKDIPIKFKKIDGDVKELQIQMRFVLNSMGWEKKSEARKIYQ